MGAGRLTTWTEGNCMQCGEDRLQKTLEKIEANVEVTMEVTKEVIREADIEVPGEVPVEVTEEVPVEVTEEVPVEVTEVTMEVPREVTREVIREVTEEVTRDVTRNEKDGKESLRGSSRDRVTACKDSHQIKPTFTGSENKTRSQISPMSIHAASSLSSSSFLSSSSASSSSALLCSSDSWVPCRSSRKELMEVLDKIMLEVGEEEESEDQWQMRKIMDLAQ